VRVFVGCGSLFDDVLSKPISEFFEDVLGTLLALPVRETVWNDVILIWSQILKKVHSLRFTAKQEFIFWEVHWTFPSFNCCLFELGISGRAMMQWATLFLEVCVQDISIGSIPREGKVVFVVNLVINGTQVQVAACGWWVEVLVLCLDILLIGGRTYGLR
jgi:hypothetical protein